jgi:hypothetical protein
MMHYFQDMKLFCAGALLPAALLLGATARTEPALPPRVVDSYGKLPLSFEANRGQTARQVKFLARGAGYTLFLTGDAAVLSLHREKANAVLRMKLAGANARAGVTGADALPGKSNYFIGSDPSQWRTNVPTYGAVKYAAVYPGIDLLYHGNQRLLEYDFLVAPGADPRAIGIRFQGARKLTVNGDGALVIGFGGSEVIEPAPVVYQEIGGQRQAVAGRYVLRGKGRVGFSVADYDRSQPLVIDPTLVYSTFLGGSGDEFGTAIAVDTFGNTYVTGESCFMGYPNYTCPNFPTTPGAFQTTRVGGHENAFVSKLNATGSALVYSTYLGGSTGAAGGFGIAVDASGNAYVTGEAAPNFPTTPGAFQTTCGCSGGGGAFVTKLNATGSALVYSTYLSGSSGGWGVGIAVDASGNAYITGDTLDADFPTTPGAFQTTYGGNIDAFVSKLNAAGSALLYSTYLGGSNRDDGSSIAVDTSGNTYVAGGTQSSDFSTTLGAFQTTLGGGRAAFVSKLNATGSALLYSTYLGGGSFNGGYWGYGIAVDRSGNAYVTGETLSSDFPTTPGAFQITYGGDGDAFVSKLNATGAALVYSTLLGGSGEDRGSSIAVDTSGNAYVIGTTSSSNFPVTPGAPQISLRGAANAFVSTLDALGSVLVSSTYLGGSGNNSCGSRCGNNSYSDSGYGIAVDASGNAYVTGWAASPDFPTTPGAFQTAYGGGIGDVFITKLSPGASVSPPVTTANLNGPSGNNGWYLGAVTVTLVATPGSSPVSATYYSVDGGPYLGYGAPFSISPDGIHQLMFYSVDTAGDQETPHGQTIKIDATKPVSHVTVLPATATTPNFNVQWSGTDATSGLANYTIYVSDNGGPFAPWLSQVTYTQAYYTGSLLHTYGFYSIALDVAGNQENPKTAAEATTHVPQMPGDVNGDSKINCADIALVKVSFGKRTGQPGFNPNADVNHDGVVNVLDLAIVSQKLAPGTKCP